jgi:hypothetical protein
MNRLLLALAFMGCVCGCGVQGLNSDNAIDLLDKTETYKGKTVTVSGYSLARYEGDKTRSNYLSVPIEVLAKKGSFRLNLSVPPSISVPPLDLGHTFKVTFVCNEGNLNSGNVVTRLVRE